MYALCLDTQFQLRCKYCMNETICDNVHYLIVFNKKAFLNSFLYNTRITFKCV